MFQKIARAGALSAALLLPLTAAQAEIEVVASIPPVHSLVSKVMKGIAEPYLLLRGSQSPHDYTLRPSDARALENATLVFLVSPGIEAFLDSSLDAAAGDGRFIELGKAEGILRLPVREGVLWEHDDHGHEGHGHEEDHGEGRGEEAHAEHDQHGPGHGEKHDEKHGEKHAHEGERHTGHADGGHGHDAQDHDHGAYDPHVWLNTRNAIAFVNAIEKALTERDPAHAARYAENADAARLELQALGESIAASLAPVRERPFLVFHDAYQYFEAEFALPAAGAIAIGSAAAPGAKRLRELRRRVSEGGIHCIFRETQFSPRLAEVVAKGTGARLGLLDPIGSSLAFGPDNYNGLMRGLANSFLSCLKQE